MIVANTVILNGADASVNQTSTPIYLDQPFGFSVQAIVTGSPVGHFILQASCDPGTNWGNGPVNATGVVNWTDMPNTYMPVSAAGTYAWNRQTTLYKWARLLYVATSGSGSITATVNVKGNF